MGLVVSRKLGEGVRLWHRETGEVLGDVRLTRTRRGRGTVQIDAPDVIRIERLDLPRPAEGVNAEAEDGSKDGCTEVLPWVPSEEGPRPAA